MLLITGGCSFTDESCHKSWPFFVAKGTSSILKNTGLGSSGNGLISKRVIYEVDKFLKNNNAEDLLVGIMWSGFTRHEIYQERPIDLGPYNWAKTNTNFVKDSPGAWIMVNWGWDNHYAKNFYAEFDIVNGAIQTIEHILRTQWFLKIHNIKYFMTTFTSETIPIDLQTHPEIKWLYDQIDFDYFLPVLGEYEWCFNKDTPIDTRTWTGDWLHPETEHHESFANNVILPWVKDRYFT